MFQLFDGTRLVSSSIFIVIISNYYLEIETTKSASIKMFSCLYLFLTGMITFLLHSFIASIASSPVAETNAVVAECDQG